MPPEPADTDPADALPAAPRPAADADLVAAAQAAAPLSDRLPRRLREFLATETAGAVVLFAATVVALVWANSPWSAGYDTLWHTHVAVTVGRWALRMDLHQVVNDALMTVFFFVVGLEIKSEMVTGDLSDPRAAALPAIAATGGMIVPALVYAAFTAGTVATHGWGIPMATDIAFALGVVALFGRRLPDGLRLFLLTLAVVDDIGAIVVIAVVYSGPIRVGYLAGAVGLLALVVVARRSGLNQVAVYGVVGTGVWLCTFESGVHATIAGVALGLLAPARPVIPWRAARGWAHRVGDAPSVGDVRTVRAVARSSVPVTERLQHALHPVTSFVIVPLFALANAGVRIDASTFRSPTPRAVALGVAVGLVGGKLVGVGSFTWLAVRTGVGRLPDGVTWGHVIGAAGVAGIGFTVSLFVADLAFPGHPEIAPAAKLGVLAASTIAALVGAALLAATRNPSSGVSPPERSPGSS